MNLEQLAAWLFDRTSGGVRWGLERTREMLSAVGDPQLGFRSLHIGGTNGKGSVAALCASALQGSGRRVGLYTSPHLVSFTERIRIDGQPVAAERVLSAAERLRPGIERSGATFFEATTAIAFLCLAEAEVQVAVVEVGMGGRLDATNVLRPEATAVTNVALDHTEYLGDTLAEIATEKAGIFKAGVPAITGEQRPEVLQALTAGAETAGATLARLDEVAALEEVWTGVEGTRLRFRSAAWGERELEVPLPGGFQARNALLAAELLALLPAGLRPRWEELRAGFAATRWPGRLQVERLRGTTFVFDVAHNPAGVAALCEALDRLTLPRPMVLLAGVLADKEWSTMLPSLLEHSDAAILTIPPSAIPSRRWDPEAAAAALQPQAYVPIRAIPDLGRALDRAVTLAPHGTILVTGSIHTVGDAMQALDISPLGNLSSRPLSKWS